MKKLNKNLEDYIYETLGFYGDDICCATLALILKRNNVKKIENIQDIELKVKKIKSKKDLEIYNIIFKQSLKELLGDINEEAVFIDILNKFLTCSENELIEYSLNENIITDDARNDMFGYLNLNELCMQLLNVENYKNVLCIDDISGIIQSKLFNKYNINIDTYENINCEEIERRKEEIINYKKIRKYIVSKNSNLLNMELDIENFESKYDFAIASSYSLEEKFENFKQNNEKKSLNEIFNNLKTSNIKKHISSDYIVALKMLDALKEKGKGIMIFHSTALSNISEREIRKELIKRNYIEGIIKIRTNYSLVIFNKNKKDKNIKIYDTQNDTEYIDKSYKFDIDNILKKYNSNSTIVRLEKIIENNYSLNTNLYLEVPNFDEKVKLKEVIADLFRGYQITKQQLEEMKVENIKEANYKLLEIGCINDEGEIISDLTMINSKGKNLDRYLLKDGDIVLTARGDKIKVAYIEIKTNERIIANGSINVIRVDKEIINPKYLKIFFESEVGKRTLENIKIGYTTPSLNTGDLKNITIPCPSNLYLQNELVEEYDKIKNKIKNCKQDLYEITNKGF